MPDLNEKVRCMWCGFEGLLVWVHGHGQCSNCGINIDECCRGEACESKNDYKEENSNSKEGESRK